MIATPKKAATVILLRELSPRGFEVFLLKRHEQSNFFAGNYVYPGGKVDRADADLEICRRCRGVNPELAHWAFGELLTPEESFAHYVAGIRELFEEAGILIAYDQTGDLLRIEDPEERKKFSQYRHLLDDHKITFHQMAQQENLSFALDRIHYLAHWITPEARPIRFDTRFFLTRLPKGQEAICDQKETTVGAWMTPRKALKENLYGEMVLSPPTLKTLEDLSRFEYLDDVLRSAPGKEIRPILPVLSRIGDLQILVFPWDPEYEIFQTGILPKTPDHGRPSGTRDNTTRLLLKQGHWHPYCRT